MGNSVGKEATIQESVVGDTGRPPRKQHEATRESAAADERRTTEDSPTLVSGLRLVEGIVDTSGSPSEHDILVAWIRGTLERGRAGELPGNTYAPIPEKWRKRNQSREMLQFGTYTHSNRVETHVPVAPLPPELDAVVDALIARGALTELQRPDSCTINLYRPGQWIPPHIDNPAFDRPFVTVSLCSEQPMVLGRGMAWPEGGQGQGPSREERLNEECVVSLPVGSAVVVEGDAADAYEHAVPPVTAERISLTFRRRGQPGSAETDERTRRAERCRRRCRDVRGAIAVTAEARAGGVRRGFGPVGPIGAIGRVGPLPAKKEADKRREGSVIKKPMDGSENVGTGVLSKNAAKKEARKAAKAAAKARARAAGPIGAVHEPTLVTAVDGAVFERKEKVRSCPACPPDLLPTTSDANDANESDAAGRVAPPRGEDAGVSVAEAIPVVERVHVQRVYDAVATQWHGTRYRAWSGVEDFVRRHVRPGSLVADVGCGNGKNLPGVESLGGCGVGCDFSLGLLEICAVERGLEVFAGDATCLPLRSRSFDVALNIAVLHHVSSEPRRRKLVTETMRLLTVGGTALFYAWALEQAEGGVSGHHFESQDVLVPFHKKAGVQGKAVVTGGSGGSGKKEVATASARGAAGEDDDDDPAAPRVYQRYCHVYKEGELVTLFEHVKSWVKVNRAYFDCGNWCVEAERIA